MTDTILDVAGVERLAADLEFSFCATPMMWRTYRTTAATLGFVKDLYGMQQGSWQGLAKHDPVRMLHAACERGAWDLDLVTMDVQGIVASQPAPEQRNFYSWIDWHAAKLARYFDLDALRDDRILTINAFLSQVGTYQIHPSRPSWQMTAALSPIWFEICDAAMGVEQARAVTA